MGVSFSLCKLNHSSSERGHAEQERRTLARQWRSAKRRGGWKARAARGWALDPVKAADGSGKAIRIHPRRNG